MPLATALGVIINILFSNFVHETIIPTSQEDDCITDELQRTGSGTAKSPMFIDQLSLE